MQGGTNWFSWLSVPIFAPFSGAVTQDITTTVARGDPATEAEIYLEIGLGRQLGIISEALDDLVEKLERAQADGRADAVPHLGRGDDASPLGKLRRMVAEVAAIKDRNKAAAREDAVSALDRLGRLDPGAFRIVARRAREV